jgi:hypothetical protein
MKSFKDYFQNRNNTSITEMAVPKITLRGKKIGHRIKTPIQLDQDDIDFLQQVPPEFWAQAVNRRYGSLLYKAHQAHLKGERIPETVNIDITGKAGSNLTFTIYNAKVNELYEELSGAEDSTRYSKLNPDDLRDKESIEKNYYSDEKGRRTDFLGKKLTKYGFDFDNFTIEKIGQFYEGNADGYVVPGKVVCAETMKQWMDHLEQGWHDDEIKGEKGIVNFGTKKHTKNREGEESGDRVLPISGQRTWRPGVDFTVTTRTKKASKSYKPITSGVPDVRPGFHIRSEARKQHDHYSEVSRRLSKVSSKDLEDYLSLFTKEYLLNPNFTEVEIIDLGKVYKLNEELALALKSQRKNNNKIIQLKKLLEFAFYFTDPKTKEENKRNFVSLYKAYEGVASGDKEQKHETAIRNAIEKTVAKVKDLVEQKRINIIKTAERFNVHQLNAFRHNSSLGSKMRDLVQVGGVFEPHKQQPAVDYQKVLDVFGGEVDDMDRFAKYIVEDLNVQEDCLFGVIKQIGNLEDMPEVTIEGKFIKSLKEAMKENRGIIAKNAVEQFSNKIGLYTLSYAKYFKQKVIDGGMDEKSFLDITDPKILKVKKSVKNSANYEGMAFSQQVFQLHKRFLARKYDRNEKLRPENPWMIGLSLIEIIEMFHSGNARYSDLAPVTSHSIETLKKAAERKIVVNDLGNKEDKQVNNSDDEKSMNVGIFRATIDKLAEKIKSIGSNITAGASAAASRLSGAVSGASDRLSSIMKSLIKKPEGPTEQPEVDPKNSTPQDSKTAPTAPDAVKQSTPEGSGRLSSIMKSLLGKK